MRKLKKVLKWTGLTLLALILILTVAVALRQDLKFDAPYPEIKATTDSAVIARGRELVLGPAHCISCHGPKNNEELLKAGKDIPLHGGYSFELPFGSFYARNITPDSTTGIGRYTDPEIARILRYGVKPDGSAVLDFMPFHNMSDEDLTAVISYLRAQKPVKNEVPEHKLNPVGMALKAFLIKPVGPDGEVPKSVKRDSTIEYGRYLALNVANCSGCHTKRGPTGEYIGQPFAGGGPMEEPGHPALTPPNISGDSASRLMVWSESDFIARFRRGKQIPYTHMPWNSYNQMSDVDLKALYRFLKSVRAGQPAEPALAKK
ncbi:MAG TPA: c-type cytochrome [Chitinophagaceae bacterium]|jgi:mono/diheme cytochrome c family protein|nr:c-type cytochrome [Chitinophagaceae bacterium]